ncbi:DUF5634 family protein [Priestia sp. YIM B13446]|uniref:DUF5634 family protein n=1 Tax=Priestia TaxID=2800373 RepID=UPI000762B935|nr:MULTISPECIES: DUF5634 family protein [Priestia]RCX28617.1 hypothetical protein DEU47_101167 [Bacillus sp. AG236]KWU53396.1 hypothetical protein AWX17_07845 [Priestia megaterium]MBX9993679.1 DUF5634 family protein [Priestia aryabhattai]MDC7770940.1 DUF5634 family protein [Priestia megaterium]MED4061014.1 DUF5634 family protein [Priestia megaterium]
MEYVKRETAISELTHHMDDILNKYNLQGVSVYEEEGEGNHYYLGYTVKKNDHVFMLNRPYLKDKDGKLAVENQEWTVQGNEGETNGYTSLEDAFQKIDEIVH